MSYNIDTTEMIAGACLRMSKAVYDRLRADLATDLPEDCFLTDDDAVEEDDESVWITRLAWNGTGSGRSFEGVLLAKVLPATHGHADYVVTWEGGDTHSGLRVRDGVVTQHRVTFALGDELCKKDEDEVDGDEDEDEDEE